MNYLMECSNCGAENKLLFKTISKNGIIKVCNQCLGKLKSPIINDSSRVDFEKPEVKLTVGERLARLAGVKLEKRRIEPIKPEQNNKLKREEDKLKEMINKNYVKKFEERPDDNMTLIENFHWVIMRARRSKKITQEQLAESISEPIAAIAMAENGKIATGNQKLITKIENALGIRLVKSDEIQKTNNEIKRPVEVPRELSFDSSSAKTLTISNLQEIKKQKEARILKENEEKNYSVSPSFVEGINKVENYDYLNESIVLDEKLENKETSAKYFDSKGKEIALSTPKRIERELIKPKKDLSPQEIREMIFGKNR